MGGDTGNLGQFLGLLVVSIAGGDSWVGILAIVIGPCARDIVSIAGGDSWVGILDGTRGEG